MRNANSIAGEPSGRNDALLSTVSLSAFDLRRDPPRPINERGPGYEARFDFDTLFFDVFRGADGNSIVCLGPPLLNCEAALAEAEFRLPGATAALAHEYHPPRSQFQPSCRFRIVGPGLNSSPSVILHLCGRALEVPIRPSGQERFAGRRVITTLSKDNPLDWIGDWVTFNSRVHGADAAIIYDNGSTTYNADAVCDHIRRLRELAAILVVPWPFPYGSTSSRGRVQDSFYCQLGALEHVRRRYCPMARSVLNTDIDELVVTPPGETIFERVERSGRAVVYFHGIWMETPGHARCLPIRHTDCIYAERIDLLRKRLRLSKWLLRTKWIAVPSRCDDNMAWGVHNVYAMDQKLADHRSAWRLSAEDVFYRHFVQLTSKNRRKRTGRRSVLRHSVDRELAAAFAVAFPSRRTRRNGLRSSIRRRLRMKKTD